MPAVILFIVVAIVISVAGIFMNPDRDLFSFPEQSSQEEQITPGTGSQTGGQTGGSKTSGSGQTTATVDPNFPINSYIKYGPIKEDILTDTTTYVFEFDAMVSNTVNKNDVYFETKITGIDSSWVRAYGKEREVKFPSGVKEYLFQVRARTNSLTESTPAERTIKISVSPYFGKIDITDVDPPDVYANPSLITITTNLGSSEQINITGWQVKGKLSAYTIPKGIEKYVTGSQTTQNIILKSGNRIYVSGETSPFGNVKSSFKTNKCMGYLDNSFDFIINIEKNCPRPEEKKLPRYLSDSCRNYILGLNTCEESTYQGLLKYDLLKDELCKGYLDSVFNYTGCLANYSEDSNFLGNQWHIYMDRKEREIMHATQDTIYLLDQSGLMIDKYCYGDSC